MANFELARPAPFGAITIYRTVDTVFTAISAVLEWNQSRKTRQMLHNLSDELLLDIGLCRGDVERF